MSVGEFWPEKGIVSNEWVLNRRDSAPASLSGGSIAVPLGEPYWTIDVTVEVPARGSELEAQWASFFARRKGRSRTFTANRSFQSFPFSKTTPPASAEIDYANRALSTMRVTGISGHTMSSGDMLSFFTEQNGYYVGEVSNISAQSSTAAIFEVEPSPFTPHPSTPSLRLVKALGEFRLDASPSPTEKSGRRGWSFKATQVIRG